MKKINICILILLFIVFGVHSQEQSKIEIFKLEIPTVGTYIFDESFKINKISEFGIDTILQLSTCLFIDSLTSEENTIIDIRTKQFIHTKIDHINGMFREHVRTIIIGKVKSKDETHYYEINTIIKEVDPIIIKEVLVDPIEVKPIKLIMNIQENVFIVRLFGKYWLVDISDLNGVIPTNVKIYSFGTLMIISINQ